jgi:predicted dehydrogenase
MTEQTKVRLGIVGLGNIAQQHLENVLAGHVPGCEIAAVCSRTLPPIVERLSLPYFSDYRMLVDSGVCEALIVASPTHTHRSIGEYALRSGLHVLMEKPLGLSVQEGQELLAAQSSGVVFALMLNQRADPLFTRMHEIVTAGELGPLTRVQWTMTNWFRPEVYFQVSDWRATWRGEGGGLLLNQCIHNLDILQWLCGMPQRLRAFCHFGKFHAIEVEDEVTAYFEYPNGATGVFIGSTGEAPGSNRLHIVGDRGSLLFDGERLLLSRNTPGTAEFNLDTQKMFGMPDTTVEDITPVRDINQHASLLTNFVAAIRSGEPLTASAAEGLHALELANGMLLSTWEDTAINLPLDGTRYQTKLDEHIRNSSLRVKAGTPVEIDMQRSYR